MSEVSLKEHLESLFNQRFDAGQRALTAALAAQKELTDAAFAASEKAITKAEQAQASYNQTHNDLSRKMDEQYKEMMPRSESLARHQSHELRYQELKDDFSKVRLEVKDDLSKLRAELMSEVAGLRESLVKEIRSLSESRSEGEGKGTGKESMGRFIAVGVGLLVTLFMAALTVGGVIVGIAYAIRR